MTLLIDETAVHLRATGVVRVTGPDRRSYLHTLLSQHLEDARPGDVADFLYLDAKGNPRAAGRAVVHAEAVLLVVPAGVAADLAAALEQYKFMLEVQAEDVSADWALASVRGPEPIELVGARSQAMTAAPHGGGLVVRDRSGGVDLLGLREWVEERVAGLGLPLASPEQWDAWRILAGVPEWSNEIASGRRAQELGLLPTHVHLQKGCYPGQESIAKIYNLGRPRRALAVVELDGAPEPDVPLEVGSKTGEVTSLAVIEGRAVALAMLPVDRETGEIIGDGTVRADGVAGRVLRRVGAGLPQPGQPTVRAGKARP
jgi:tRNA-modifying protein YgfZ